MQLNLGYAARLEVASAKADSLAWLVAFYQAQFPPVPSSDKNRRKMPFELKAGIVLSRVTYPINANQALGFVRGVSLRRVELH